MGKSLGNYVGVGEPAYDQFAKTMSIPDDIMREWFELLTDRPTEEVARLTDPQATHPMEAKKALGRDIVAFYYGADAAAAAQAEWEKRFSQRQDPTDIPAADLSAAELSDGKMAVAKLLVALKLVSSNNDARRQIEGGGVTLGPEREKVTDPTAQVAVSDGLIVRVGKKRIVRVRLR
jgi:tyrosyl-tRNA synthetase